METVHYPGPTVQVRLVDVAPVGGGCTRRAPEHKKNSVSMWECLATAHIANCPFGSCPPLSTAVAFLASPLHSFCSPMVQSAPSRRPNPRWGALLIGLALVLALASQCVPRRADLSLWAQASALRNAPAVARAPLHPVRATAAASAAAARAAPGPQRPSPASAAAPQAAPPSPAASLSGALLRRGADVVAAVLATAGLVLWRGACRRRALVLHSARPPIAMCAATSEKAEEAAALAKRETHLPKVLGSVAAAAVFGAGVLLFKGVASSAATQAAVRARLQHLMNGLRPNPPPE